MIRLLLAEADAARAGWLQPLLEAAGLHVVARASSGEQAVAQACQCHPQVALISFHLPDFSGAEAARRIMELHPVPIVLLLEPDDRGTAVEVEASRCGATWVAQAPPEPDRPGHQAGLAELAKTLHLMHEIPVVKRSSPRTSAPPPRPASVGPPLLIGLAASTGGPAAVQTLLQGLTPDFPIPMLLVQHISDGFASTLVDWLSRTTPLRIIPAEDGVAPSPGTLYVAAGQQHLVVRPGPVLGLEDGAPLQGHRPSATLMLQSLARTLGSRAAGIILTGMGDDGAQGLLELHRQGGLTYAQDERSCVVYGMPREAVRQGAVGSSLSLPDLAATLMRLAGMDPPKKETSF